jgi:hypothetical protein
MKLAKLLAEYERRAQTIRDMIKILEETNRRHAVAALPTKIRAAMQHRKSRKASTNDKPPISGKRLSLFLLEHLSETKSVSSEVLHKQLSAAAGSAMSLLAVTSPLAAGLGHYGYVKRRRDGYRLTAKGAKYAATLRQELETAKVVAPGGYLLP